MSTIAIVENRPLMAWHFASFLRSEMIDFRVFHAWREKRLPGWLTKGNTSALILTGDLHNVTEGLRDYHKRELELLDSSRGKRVFASCFSHQMIAVWKGGTVTRRADRLLGWEEFDTGERHPALCGVERLKAVCLNLEEVVAPPPGAELLAASENCACMVLAYGDEILTCQSHPELANSRLFLGALALAAAGPTLRYRAVFSGMSDPSKAGGARMMRGVVRWLAGQ